VPLTDVELGQPLVDQRHATSLTALSSHVGMPGTWTRPKGRRRRERRLLHFCRTRWR
jgi:hypothetical protein